MPKLRPFSGKAVCEILAGPVDGAFHFAGLDRLIQHVDHANLLVHHIYDGNARDAARVERLATGSRIEGTAVQNNAARILERHGFQRVRQRGSHVVMQIRTKDGTTTVPVPLHRELRIGTLQSIIRQSGLARAQFDNPE